MCAPSNLLPFARRLLCCEYCSNTSHFHCHLAMKKFLKKQRSTSFSMGTEGKDGDFLCDHCCQQLVKMVKVKKAVAGPKNKE